MPNSTCGMDEKILLDSKTPTEKVLVCECRSVTELQDVRYAASKQTINRGFKLMFAAWNKTDELFKW